MIVSGDSRDATTGATIGTTRAFVPRCAFVANALGAAATGVALSACKPKICSALASRAANKFAKVVRRSHRILNSCDVAFEIKLLATTTLDVAFGVEADVEVAGREGGGKATEERVEGRAMGGGNGCTACANRVLDKARETTSGCATSGRAGAAVAATENVKVAATIDVSNSTLRCSCSLATNFGANWVSVGFNRSPNAFLVS